MTSAATIKPRARWRKPSVLPGFGISFGFVLAYLSLIVLIPLSALVMSAASIGWKEYVALVEDPYIRHALYLSFWTSLAAALVNTVFGVIIAWTLVRYRFPGRKLLDAAVDLPFALPTAVAGIALVTLYVPDGPFGKLLAPLGIQAAYSPLGIVIALIFIGIPFVVRTVQPVMEDMERDTEEVSATLGAGRLRTIFAVVLPTLAPSILTGFAMAFARGVGEYGSVIFISGNKLGQTEIAPLMIVQKLEAYKYGAATAIAVTMLVFSFLALLGINLIQAWSRRRFGHV